MRRLSRQGAGWSGAPASALARVALLAGGLAAAWGGVAGAQQLAPQGGLAGEAATAARPVQPLALPVVTLDQQSLFTRSLFGKRALADLEAARNDLIVESDALAAELTAAEQDLTERRPSLSPEAFRDLADAFDARAEEIRRRQDAKDSALLRALAAEQQRFFALASPALADLAREIGAVAILSPQAVLLSVGPIDITDLAVARLDKALGEDGTGGGTAPSPTAEPSAQP